MNALGKLDGRLLPLRAAFALVFLLMTSFQPGFFAMASASGHAYAETVEVTANRDHSHAGVRHHHEASAETHQHSTKHEHRSGKHADKSCEVSCAPCAAVLSEYPGFLQVNGHCHAAEAVVVAELGGAGELNRPPRS